IRDQAAREQELYEQRISTLVAERDARAAEAVAAQERFNQALAQVSEMQSAFLASEDRRSELEKGIGVIQSTLRRTMQERDAARGSLEAMLAEARDQDKRPAQALFSDDASATIDFLTETLAATASERDMMAAQAEDATKEVQDLIYEARLRDQRNDQIFQQLDDAVSISLEPLDKMFKAAGMSPEKILSTIRAGYSGQGGPLTPLVLSTKGGEPDPDMLRANTILTSLDRMNLYRLAAEKIPLGKPVKASFRLSSPFGMRWGRLHGGVDMAAPTGTPIYATADGEVVYAGWSSGYGRLIKIRHAFGRETRYAHLSAIKVQKGQRVSLGQRIGDMGSSGRSTGPHLHYEVRVEGKPVNPMIYLKAAKNVF
ncbi:MAG TPA: M23 family peptidase, partial [Aliiroseovarius sp.]|nr:M23 family peptidase [Aliiroseovarius sp.]